MSKPTIKIHNVETNEVFEREMTSEELTQYEKNLEEFRLEEIQLQNKKAARQAILDRLGLTEEEARLLLG